ncbi:MAG: TraR/DksA family transcriptional regulator [Chlamydiia bacterium]|nr:TraR/DksA family transcriptional regulator [Chlamydiia bacterium]
MSKYSSNSFRQDIVDVSSDDIEDKICISLSGKEKEIIVKIERALEKMEEGSYGICDVTGEAIPIGRLEAIPYATMTVGAQRDMESNNYSDGF